MPSLSWSTIIEKIHGESGTARAEVHYFLGQAVDFLKTKTKNISVLEVGFDIGDHLVEFKKQGCSVSGVVYDLEFLDKAVTRCMGKKCDVRLYLSSDKEVHAIRNIHVLIVSGMTFLQIAHSEINALEFISRCGRMLSSNAVMIFEVSNMLTKLDRPYLLTNSDGSRGTITQKIQSLNAATTHIRETLTYQAASGNERIAVQNIRTFRIWNYLELVRIFQIAGFGEVRLDNTHGKRYVVVHKGNSLAQRKDVWQTRN